MGERRDNPEECSCRNKTERQERSKGRSGSGVDSSLGIRARAGRRVSNEREDRTLTWEDNHHLIGSWFLFSWFTKDCEHLGLFLPGEVGRVV